jgi:putative OPT family oligopeptide transporter
MSNEIASSGHQPYVPPDKPMAEFTLSAILVGAVLGIIFGASSLYLVLKVGMTVSASIPVAVLSITLFRFLSKTFGMRVATILENNIVQTTGSAGESIAFGVGVTMPALLLIGFDMEWTRVMVVAVLGGLLGILMMIPLRRAFIVKMHGKPGDPNTLLYPEGTACAQVLISGEKGGMSGMTVFVGFGLAFLHKFFTEGLNLLVTTVSLPLKLGRNAADAFSRVASINSDMASELLGVGYIIGLRTSAVMMAGAILGGLVLVPTLAISSDMSAGEIYRTYLRSIGAGCVAAAGIISMARTLPMIITSFTGGLSGMRGGLGAGGQNRTEDDMSMNAVLGGGLSLVFLLALFLIHELAPQYGIGTSAIYAVLGAILVIVFGFLFVTVSSRLTGEIGSSSNPISGMTVATLLMTCLIFLGLGMTEPMHAVLALSIGGVVCIAASNGGTTSQDLKTGFLLGATPKWQQWAILIGAITSAVVIGGTLLLFNSVGTVYSQRNLPQVDAKSMLEKATETMTLEKGEGESRATEELRVWRNNTEELLPTLADPKAKLAVPPGIFLLDVRGQIAYQVDPTITGKVDQRDELKPAGDIKVKLDRKDVERIKNTFAVRENGKIRFYRLWNNDHEKAEEEAKRTDEEKKKSEPARTDVPKGLYLVDEDGTIVNKVDGTKVAMKFGAPKTQVMGIIINGLLQGKLDWALVLIGACIAIMLEFCGVSSLAFAVGLYIPMQYSTPIFIGGIVRWCVDWYTARQLKAEAASHGPISEAEAEVKAIAKSETSPGMLLASGLIAGGSLAGVTIAFMEFLPKTIKDKLDLTEFAEGLFKNLFGEAGAGAAAQAWALLLFLLLATVLLLAGIGAIFKAPPETPSPPQPPSVPDTRIKAE